MRVTVPIAVTDAVLTYSSVPEPDPAVGEVDWAAGTNWDTGDQVVRTTTHRVYERLSPGGTDATTPEADVAAGTGGVGTMWKELRATNRWSAFDNEVGTASTETGTSATLQMVLTPGQVINSLNLLEVRGQQAHIVGTVGTDTVFDKTYDLEQSDVYDWFMYFMEPYTFRETLIINDIPAYAGIVLTLTITGGSEVRLGVCAIGTQYELGSTELDVQSGIRSFSRKEEDSDSATVRVERRKNRKTLSGVFMTPTAKTNFVSRLMQSLDSVLCVWSVDNGDGLDALVAYGFWRDYRLTVKYKTISYYSFDIEGMI